MTGAARGSVHLARDEAALGRVLHAFQQHHELVARQARDQVSAAHTGGQTLAERHQYRVPRGMAEVVVDALEVVDVEVHQRGAGVHARRARQSLL